MGANPHNPGGRGLGEIPRAELEGRMLAAEARIADLEAANGRLAEWLSECAMLLYGLWRTPDEFFPVSPAIGDALTRWAKHPSHLIADALGEQTND